MRKISKWYPPRIAAKTKCKVDEALYKCSKCGTFCYEGKSQKNYDKYVEKYPDNIILFEPPQLDHILAVIDPLVGYSGLDSYAERLFVPEEYWRCLCSNCHGKKTLHENKVRTKVRKSKKENT